jgi:hypothetical protein
MIRINERKKLILEHFPDIDESLTIVDGRTRAVPYSRNGYNCNSE